MDRDTMTKAGKMMIDKGKSMREHGTMMKQGTLKGKGKTMEESGMKH